jgi:hypothetical protein
MFCRSLYRTCVRPVNPSTELMFAPRDVKVYYVVAHTFDSGGTDHDGWA